MRYIAYRLHAASALIMRARRYCVYREFGCAGLIWHGGLCRACGRCDAAGSMTRQGGSCIVRRAEAMRQAVSCGVSKRCVRLYRVACRSNASGCIVRHVGAMCQAISHGGLARCVVSYDVACRSGVSGHIARRLVIAQRLGIARRIAYIAASHTGSAPIAMSG